MLRKMSIINQWHGSPITGLPLACDEDARWNASQDCAHSHNAQHTLLLHSKLCKPDLQIFTLLAGVMILDLLLGLMKVLGPFPFAAASSSASPS